MNFFPEVIMHTRQQDEDQIRSNYDRGTDFYSWCANLPGAILKAQCQQCVQVPRPKNDLHFRDSQRRKCRGDP